MPETIGKLLSVQVGRIQTHRDEDPEHPGHKGWRTAFVKTPVAGPVRVGELGLRGDQQADKRYHGGPDRAALAYCGDHYPKWREELGMPEMGPGGFGENLTVTGHDEAAVCIGDRLRMGGVVFEITQHRGPCAKIDRRWSKEGLCKSVTQNGRTGWYLRVIEAGVLEAGQEVILEARPYPDLTVAGLFQARLTRKVNRALAEKYLACPAIPADVKEALL